MATIVEIGNPFTPLKDTRRYTHVGGVTIRAILEEQYPGFKEFARPTVCFLNGKPIMRKPLDGSPGWDSYTVAGDDVINFVTNPGAINLLYFIVVALIAVAAVALVLSMPKPVVPGEQPAPDPVFDLKGQRNQNRLSHPIEVPYGRCRLFPSYASRPYNEYIDNKQFQYSLYCLGQGEFDIESVQFEDTDIANFKDTTYEVYGPGVAPSMFPNNVVTSSEVGGIELFGPNEPDYVIVGPFAANEPGTLSDKIQVDISFPTGLYKANKDGTLGLATLGVKIEYRAIDDDGAPVGAGTWLELFFLNESLKTNTPQRFTLQQTDLTPSRWEVRAYRTNNKDTDSGTANTARWEALRAYLPSTHDFGNVTTVAVRAVADNNLNDNSAQRFNIWATRKLPTRVGGSWTGVTATRNPIWAFCDVFRATYGGQLADMFIDLADLDTLAATMVTETRYFDFVFDQRITVWDAATTIARVFRARPMLNGSQITIIRDIPKSVISGVFTQDNIVKDSLRWEIKLPQVGDYDGVQIQYVDPTSWKDETVDCLVGDDGGNNLEQITLAGCTQRDYAYQEGMYIRATRKMLRENITFQTGLEGHVPSYGDLIKISHDLPRWGTAGLVLAIAVDNKTITLSEPVEFAMGSNVIGFRKKDGSEHGPHTCTAGANANEIVLDSTIDPSIFFFDGKHEYPIFYFGVAGSEAVVCSVVGLTPSDEETVEIKAVVYTSDIFTSDGTPGPSIPPRPVLPPFSTVPVLNCASVNSQWLPTGKVLIGWSPAIGARGYNVETSFDDGASWNAPILSASSTVQIDHNKTQALKVRVTPLGNGTVQGTTCTGPNMPEGPPNPPKPPSGGDYWDLAQLVGSASVLIDCKIRTGTALLCGFPEFKDPSDPPKFYRTLSNAGELTEDVFQPSLDCGANLIVHGPTTYDLVCRKDASTCADSTTGSTGSCDTPVDSGGTGFNITIVDSPTSARIIGGGCFVWSGIQSRNFSGVVNISLSDEDTEDDALSRLVSTLPDWSTIDWGSDDCFSERGSRSTNSFVYQECKIRLRTTGLTAAGLSVIRCFISRINLDTLVDEPAEEQTFSTYADDLGGSEFEFDLPVVAGYKYYLNHVEFYQI